VRGVSLWFFAGSKQGFHGCFRGPSGLSPTVPSPKGTAPRLQRRGPSPKAVPRQSRPPQAIAPMGGTLRRRQSSQTRHLQAGQRGRRGTHQRLEHPTTTSLLPLERISKSLFVTYVPNTPVGCTNVNSIELISQRATRLSPENQVPLGGYCGGHPPPKKNGPIFSQKFVANVLSMPRPKLWVNLRGTRVAKGRRSVSRGQPTPLAGYDPSPSPLFLQATRANETLPSQGSPKKMGKAEEHNCRNK
jgi:hypothetical protein